ncbi:MAG: efflux RND transporter permease subunit [Planctomycetes bacterium]|nr:efflux RND transporter permease subunit [Planctomycetota bacterium]
MATVLAFLPLVLLQGAPGDFVGAIGMSVIIAVSWSFVTALTITVALAGIFAKPSSKDSKRRMLTDGLGSDRLTMAYRWILSQGLRMPVAMIAVGLFLPLVGFMLAPSRGNSFFPPADRDMFEVRVWMPNDSSIRNTQAYAEEIEEVIRRDDEVTRIYWLIGGNFPRVYYNLPMDHDNSPHFAHAIVSTTSNVATKRVIDGLQEKLRELFPPAVGSETSRIETFLRCVWCNRRTSFGCIEEEMGGPLKKDTVKSWCSRANKKLPYMGIGIMLRVNGDAVLADDS